MYYPIQIPYILNQDFSQYMKYKETSAAECGGFIICFWEMEPFSERKISVKNIIAADACIDIVTNFDTREIGFVGMSKTNFHFIVDLPAHYIGARLMPGAFHQLTGLPASSAMDTFLPIESVFTDFDKSYFFSLPFTQASEYFNKFLVMKTKRKTPDRFTSLFHLLSENTPATAKELYQLLHFSPRQCQRIFLKYYGITPKVSLSIVRFQKCLEALTASDASPVDILNATSYYDQPHFINDFKRNIGLTPLDLLNMYRD